MASIYRDQKLLDAFKDIPGDTKASDVSTVDVLDWNQEARFYRLISHKVTVPELAQLPVPFLRIIFSSLDLPNSGSMDKFRWIFDHYSVPSAFLAGRLRCRLAISFRPLVADVHFYIGAWFHYLCKNVTVAHDFHGKAAISDPRPGAMRLEHGDSTWIRSGYFIRWKLNLNHDPEVTLLCFGASHCLKERLQQIPTSSIPNSLALDPYSLFAIILEELSLQMDNTVWDVMDVFRDIELNTLTTTRGSESFTGLHNVSKHILFLQESSEAAMLTLKSMMCHHQRILDTVSSSSHQATQAAQGMLAHTETQFQSIGLRLQSLEKRMANIIALSFHLVTQDGNRIMQEDSSSMATIAFVTLVFLPMSTVSTVFGSQFFNFDPYLVRISQSFWIFWLVSIPLTLVVLLFWRVSIGRVQLPETWDILKVWKRRCKC
ncbi:hypothetical protein N7520_007835 [Penicillium odoratum]|uniref:uncharacterized protein n=1 Tax=Penicillium odoratum TaxID=1167516 RepID=UPI0025472016|nr:uncharacterized protein N7520_007835 [Penicillium odoratum]KAJ5760679.1 hypothetical protein N7520_007835 [Penicillium odoratum]